MDELEQKTVTVLREIARSLRETSLPAELAIQVEKLATHAQGDQACVVAVVGRVKAGKSSFINALLGEDLAKVGTTETTATINYFRYGAPEQDRLVRCYWRGGKSTDVDLDFLNRLQGHDIETLRRADGIDHLEYFLPNPLLKQITLVDTPGTGTVIEEHQTRTAEFLSLYGQLRERHHQETERLNSKADAVIYLVGHIAKVSDQALLEEFARVTGGKAKALNAIGVMSQIDLQPQIMESRHELSQKISKQLEANLNTVVPVSAGIRRALDQLLKDGHSGLNDLAQALRCIPPETLELLLADSELFQSLETDACPLTTTERRRLAETMPWTVFKIIAELVVDQTKDLQVVIAQLNEVSGFDQFKKILDQHFLQRSHILRCYRAVNETRRVLDQIKYSHLRGVQKESRQDKVRLERFIGFIRRAKGDRVVAQELEDYIRVQLNTAGRLREIEEVWNAVDERLSELYYDLVSYNSDFEMLQQLEDQRDLFSPAQLTELRALLGLYGLSMEKRLSAGKISIDYVRQQQLAWRDIENSAPRGTVRRAIANCAYTRYGLILDELSAVEETPKRQ